MFYQTLNHLSQLTQHIIEQIKILDQLTSYKLTNFYRGAVRVNPKKKYLYSLKPKTNIHKVLTQIMYWNMKFLTFICIINAIESHADSHWLRNNVFLLLKLRQFLNYFIANLLNNLAFSKLYTALPEAHFQVNNCQCKQNIRLKSLILSPIFYVISLIFIETINLIVLSPINLILNAHFSGYWLLESQLANSDMCCRCRYNWLNQRNCYVLGLGAVYVLLCKLFFSALSLAKMDDNFIFLAISSLLWTSFSFIIHLNNQNDIANEQYYLDLYIFPKQISLKLIHWFKINISKNIINKNDDLYNVLHAYYYNPINYALINILFAEHFKKRQLFIRWQPVQTFMVAYKKEILLSLNWFSWLQSWYNSKTVRLAKYIIDIKKALSDYFPKTLVMMIITLMKIKFFTPARIQQWKTITQTATITPSYLDQIITFCAQLLGKQACVPLHNTIHIGNESYFETKNKKEIFLPAFKQNKDSFFSAATSNEELQIIDIRLFDELENYPPSPCTPNHVHDTSNSLLNWRYESGRS